MSAWLNHYETRMMLYRDLGIMELDDEGMWIDRPLNESEWLEEDLCPLPPPIPNHWMNEVDVEGDAEYEALIPGFGSRREDVNEGETPGIEQAFPEPPLEENLPSPVPGESAGAAGRDRPGGQYRPAPAALVRHSGLVRRTRTASPLVPSRPGGVGLSAWATPPIGRDGWKVGARGASTAQPAPAR